LSNINEQVSQRSLKIQEIDLDTERNEGKFEELLKKEKELASLEKELQVCFFFPEIRNLEFSDKVEKNRERGEFFFPPLLISCPNLVKTGNSS
jgi:hypothetical protein